MATYFERYQAGEHEQVWEELLALGAGYRAPGILEDAEAVARETMRRVRQNIETLIPRLQVVGFEFFSAKPNPNQWPGHWGRIPPLQACTPKDLKALAKIEKQAGAVPLSLRIFFEEVGSVNFIGLFPGWPHLDVEDPLLIEAVTTENRDGHLSRFEDWKEEREEAAEWAEEQGDEEEEYEPTPYLLELSPDAALKSDVCSGDPYGIYLPCNAVDSIFQNERHNTTFVNYLRLSLRWGGFPTLGGFTPAEQEAWSRIPEMKGYGETERRIARVEFLTEGLLPI